MPVTSNDKPPLFDGQIDFTGGMDASRSPELISPNQIALGVNVTIRNGYPSTRPPFNKLLLNFSDDDTAEGIWNSGLFQGAAYYNLNGTFPSIVASVGGHIFNMQPVGLGFQVSDITPFLADGITRDVNSSLLTKAYFAVADVYLVIQDGQSKAFIFDGSTLRRSNPAIPEVPVGTVMAYGQSRLAVANGNQFLIGDINGGATNVLSFTETTYLNGGGSFILPMNMGNVTAMIFNAQQDTNTGQGTLLVFGETGVISVNLTIPREQWQTSQIVTVTLTNIGTLSDRSVTTVNADIIFRSQDGIRTYRDARAEFGAYSVGNFGRTAMSYEIQNYLATDALFYLKFSSGVIFDNRYLMTTLPIMRTYGVPVFQAIAVMDFISVSALRYQQPPVFDGLWTGLDFYQVVQGKFFSGARGFAFARGADNVRNQELQLWEITTGQGNDNNGSCPIQCAVETKSFVFGNSTMYKKMAYLRHWADQLQDRTDWTLRVKPDQYPGWALWQEWTYDAPDQVCLNTECSIPNYQPQYRAGRNSVLAPEGCLTDGDLLWTYRTGYAFQLRLEWSGVARLTKLLLTAQQFDIPKLDCLVIDPPSDPITSILALAPPANQYLNQEVFYQCPAGTTGTPVTVSAGTFTSNVSVADANAQALAYAITQTTCTPIADVYLLVTVGEYTGESGIVSPNNTIFVIDGVTHTNPSTGTTYQCHSSLLIKNSISVSSVSSSPPFESFIAFTAQAIGADLTFDGASGMTCDATITATSHVFDLQVGGVVNGPTFTWSLDAIGEVLANAGSTGTDNQTNLASFTLISGDTISSGGLGTFYSNFGGTLSTISMTTFSQFQINSISP